MIGCEHCDEWYHGDCVNVTEKDAKYIKRYYCKECRDKNPNLHVVYKSKFKEIIREREKEREKHHSKKSSHSGGDKDKNKDKDKDRSERRREKERREERKRKKKESRDKERQKSEKPHHDVEAVDRKKAKKSAEPSKHSSNQRTSSLDSKPTDSPKQHQSLTSKNKNNLIKNEPKSETDNDAEVALSPQENIVKVSLSESEDAWEPSKTTTTISKSKSKESKISHKKSSQTHSKTVRSGIKRKRGRRASGSDSDLDPAAYWDFAAHLRGSRQCFGHKCTKEAREGSKYCSDNCGVNMASMRIMQTLPDRIREWNLTTCEADKRNRKELESIRAKQDAVKSSLEQLQR